MLLLATLATLAPRRILQIANAWFAPFVIGYTTQLKASLIKALNRVRHGLKCQIISCAQNVTWVKTSLSNTTGKGANMQAPIVIIGSGFAAYQLVKTVRRMDAHIPLQVFTVDDGAEYNKPDLSHVFSNKQTAQDLVVKSGEAFAQEHNIELFAHTMIEHVDVQAQQVVANGQTYPYSKLVFATGAKAFVPPISGDAAPEVITLNSLQEYQLAEEQISRAKRILVMGGGLIGVEIAMDLATSGKAVTVVEPNSRFLANLIPEFVALPLENQLKQARYSTCLGDWGCCDQSFK